MFGMRLVFQSGSGRGIVVAGPTVMPRPGNWSGRGGSWSYARVEDSAQKFKAQ